MQQNFFKIFCPAIAGQNIRMKDNERNSEYGFNYLNLFLVYLFLLNTETSALGFTDVNQGLGHRSIITKNCANKQSDLIKTFYDLKINLFLSGVHTG